MAAKAALIPCLNLDTTPPNHDRRNAWSCMRILVPSHRYHSAVRTSTVDITQPISKYGHSRTTVRPLEVVVLEECQRCGKVSQVGE